MDYKQNNHLITLARTTVSPQRRLIIEALASLGQMETGRGRLIVALDLTGSREHSLPQARIATAAMFDTIKALGAVEVKLVYFRGNECGQRFGRTILPW